MSSILNLNIYQDERILNKKANIYAPTMWRSGLSLFAFYSLLPSTYRKKSCNYFARKYVLFYLHSAHLTLFLMIRSNSCVTRMCQELSKYLQQARDDTEEIPFASGKRLGWQQKFLLKLENEGGLSQVNEK